MVTQLGFVLGATRSRGWHSIKLIIVPSIFQQEAPKILLWWDDCSSFTKKWSDTFPQLRPWWTVVSVSLNTHLLFHCLLEQKDNRKWTIFLSQKPNKFPFILHVLIFRGQVLPFSLLRKTSSAFSGMKGFRDVLFCQRRHSPEFIAKSTTMRHNFNNENKWKLISWDCMNILFFKKKVKRSHTIFARFE